MATLKPLILSRRRPKKQQAVIVKHARHVGEIMIAWNGLQSSLFMVFWALVSPKKHEIAHGIWHCIRNDKTQREMLLAAARGALREKSKILAHIEWLVTRANDLSEYRNDPAHTAINFTTGDNGKLIAVPDLIATRAPVLQRLTKTPTENYWECVRGDLWTLSYFSGSIWADLITEPDQLRMPFPRRPRLLAVPAKNKKGRRKSRSQGLIKQRRAP